MRRILHSMFAILLASSLMGCRSSVRVMAENHEYKITAIEKDGCITLCALDKKTSQTKELLKTTPDSRMFASLDYENVCSVHKDSLLCFDKVTILWDFNDTMYLAIEDSADMSNPNTHTFIFNERSDSLIHMPTNAGLMGLTTEEGYLVMQSYEYRYDVGGRYNVIDVFDVYGQRLARQTLLSDFNK